MKNKYKITVFIIIIVSSIVGLLLKGYLYDDIYVLNEDKNSKLSSESESLDKIKSNNENIQIEDSNNEDTIKNQENLKQSDLKQQENHSVSNEKITIYVSGEVEKPGVVELQNDKRLADAVEYLGGLTKKADLDNVNLAMKLKDEMHYIIPKKGDKKNQENVSNQSSENNQNTVCDNNKNVVDDNKESSNDNSTDNEKVNINTATLEQLDTLPGIGEVTAQKIVDYREENKEFKNIEEVKNVNGIGDKKYEDIKELISI